MNSFFFSIVIICDGVQIFSENSKKNIDNEESLWKDLIANPDNWRDHRMDKKNGLVIISFSVRCSLFVVNLYFYHFLFVYSGQAKVPRF